MKTFVVDLRETWCYEMLVDADNAEEAREIAIDRWNGSPDPVTYREREEPISVTREGEPCDDGDVVVICEADRMSCLPTHHVGHDGRDIR